MLEIRFWTSDQRRIREELVRVLRWLHKHLNLAKSDQEKRIITQEIESTDRQIDSLVYGLYRADCRRGCRRRISLSVVKILLDQKTAAMALRFADISENEQKYVSENRIVQARYFAG